MVSSDTKRDNFVGAKTARACDNCIRKRARWYCAADDAFLCQSCDGLVHAANPLARRHERLRLNIASLKLFSLDKPPSPPWHQGFTKKPRTPPRASNNHRHLSRQTTKSEASGTSFNPLHLVPEIGSDDMTTVSCEEQLLYQVPLFDLVSGELCLSRSSSEAVTPVKQLEATLTTDANHHESKLTFDLNTLNGLILPSDMELEEFAADVENLLGKGVDEESYAMEGLGLLGSCREKDSGKNLERVKVEEDQMQYESVDINGMEMMREPFQLSFDYNDSSLWEEKDEKVAVEVGDYMGVVKVDEDDDHVNINYKKKKIILKLDFEGIIAAWDDHRSPWTTGGRPELDPDDCWPECMGGCGIMHHRHHYHNHPYGDMGTVTGNPVMLDGRREARVSRYREKRRTRLFSKKIRYEVQKLNAEKRPRMKGRFVKRSSTLGFPLLSK